MQEIRRLYLLRHAKSSWADPNLPDHDRPLSDRGRRAAALMAAHVAAERIQPELILCSSSRRTRETLDGVGLRGTILIEDWLYDASADDLLERLRRMPSDLRSAMLIGHDPALPTLARRLARGERPGRPAGAEGLAQLERKFPTGALVTLELDGEWAELAPGCAELVDYVRPKSLER